MSWSWHLKSWRIDMEIIKKEKTYSELIENARRKVAWAKASPFASGTEHLLADSLASIIEALDVINEKADKAISNTAYSNVYR